MVAGGVGERVGREKERGGGAAGALCVPSTARTRRVAAAAAAPRRAAVAHHKNAHFDLDCGIPQNKPCGIVSVETTETFSMGRARSPDRTLERRRGPARGAE